MIYNNFTIRRAIFVDRIKNGDKELYIKAIDDLQNTINIKEMQQQIYQDRIMEISKKLQNVQC